MREMKVHVSDSPVWLKASLRRRAIILSHSSPQRCLAEYLMTAETQFLPNVIERSKGSFVLNNIMTNCEPQASKLFLKDLEIFWSKLPQLYR